MAETEDKVNVPAAVKIDLPDPDERGKFLERMNKGKALSQKYGEPDLPHLLDRVGSDSIFARRLVEDLATGSETVSVPIHPDSPQQNNVTGKIDNTGDIPKKLKTVSTEPPTDPTVIGVQETASTEPVN